MIFYQKTLYKKRYICVYAMRQSSGGWFFRSSGRYSMRIICFVEQNVNEGERLQIRVGSVESTDRDRYSTPVIDGIEYRKGDVIWIKPLYDSKWHIEGE